MRLSLCWRPDFFTYQPGNLLLMSIYTSVNEGYEIKIYRSQKAMAEDVADSVSYIVPDDEFADGAVWLPATKQNLLRAIRQFNDVRIVEEEGGRDWSLKIEKH